MPTSGSGSVGSTWRQHLRRPGWLVLPLRAFLGGTFVYAGLQKFANPDYLDASKPTSVAAQMRSLQHSSAIDPLVGLATHAPTFVGLLIATGELAVGVGTLLGLFQRVAAIGGALLSLSFFLTVSWNTSPYYYGSDIVFVFAWLTLAGFGTGGVLSVETWLRARARAALRLGPEPADVPVPASRLRALCPRAGNCGMGTDGSCSRIRGCPVFPNESAQQAATRAQVDRRTALKAGTAAALTGGGVLAVAGATAAIGRAAGGTEHHTSVQAATTPAPTSSPASSPARHRRRRLRAPRRRPRPGWARRRVRRPDRGGSGQVVHRPVERQRSVARPPVRVDVRRLQRHLHPRRVRGAVRPVPCPVRLPVPRRGVRRAHRPGRAGSSPGAAAGDPGARRQRRGARAVTRSAPRCLVCGR